MDPQRRSRRPSGSVPEPSCARQWYTALACLCSLLGACAGPLQQFSHQPAAAKEGVHALAAAKTAGSSANPRAHVAKSGSSGSSVTQSSAKTAKAAASLQDTLQASSKAAERPASDADAKEVRSASAVEEVAEPGETTMLQELGSVPGEQQEWTFEQAMQFALANHPLLRARKHEVEAAQARLITAGLLPNPQLTLDTDSELQGNGQTDLTTRVLFTVPTAGKIARQQAVARAEIARAQFAVSRETETILAEAADAAIQVLYYQESVTLQKHFSELAAQAAEVQKSLFNLQRATFADQIQADVDAADIELRRLDAASRLKAAQLLLARSIGQSPTCLIRLQGQLGSEPVPAVPLESMLAIARQCRPELGEARAAVVESQQNLSLARAEAHPDIEIGPRYQDRLGVQDDSLGARFQTDIPLFDRNQGNISENAADVRTNSALLQDTELRNLNDVASAYAEVMALLESLQYYEKQVIPLMQRTESTLLEDAQNRVIGGNQVSDILENFVRIRMRHLDLRLRYNQLRTRLEIFLGRRLSELQPAGQVLSVEEIPAPPATDPTPSEPRAATAK